MKNKKFKNSNLDEAVTKFKKNLPDAGRSNFSTFKDELYLNDQKITFIAQKIKSSNGMSWSINYTS